MCDRGVGCCCGAELLLLFAESLPVGLLFGRTPSSALALAFARPAFGLDAWEWVA